MSIFNNTITQINQNRSGRITYIPSLLPKYNNFVYGTRQRCLYLYGGETGTGKTKLARELHIYQTYDYYKQVQNPASLDINYLDFSLEMPAEENMASAISRKLYLDHGYVYSPDHILYRSAEIPQSVYEKILGYKEYFEEFEKKLFVIEEDLTPGKFHDVLMAYALRVGQFETAGRYIGDCKNYTLHNPNLYTIVLVDTINLSDTDSDHTTIKSSIDRISRIAVWFRNKCKFTFAIIQQFNAEISDHQRLREGIKTPLLRDFEDSKRTVKDANVVFGLFDPVRHAGSDQKTFYGYDLVTMNGWIRSLHLLKNRGGIANKVIPMQYKGAIGLFKQLPEATLMTDSEYIIYTSY